MYFPLWNAQVCFTLIHEAFGCLQRRYIPLKLLDGGIVALMLDRKHSQLGIADALPLATPLTAPEWRTVAIQSCVESHVTDWGCAFLMNPSVTLRTRLLSPFHILACAVPWHKATQARARTHAPRTLTPTHVRVQLVTSPLGLLEDRGTFRHWAAGAVIGTREHPIYVLGWFTGQVLRSRGFARTTRPIFSPGFSTQGSIQCNGYICESLGVLGKVDILVPRF